MAKETMNEGTHKNRKRNAEMASLSLSTHEATLIAAESSNPSGEAVAISDRPCSSRSLSTKRPSAVTSSRSLEQSVSNVGTTLSQCVQEAIQNRRNCIKSQFENCIAMTMADVCLRKKVWPEGYHPPWSDDGPSQPASPLPIAQLVPVDPGDSTDPSPPIVSQTELSIDDEDHVDDEAWIYGRWKESPDEMEDNASSLGDAFVDGIDSEQEEIFHEESVQPIDERNPEEVSPDEMVDNASSVGDAFADEIESGQEQVAQSMEERIPDEESPDEMEDNASSVGDAFADEIESGKEEVVHKEVAQSMEERIPDEVLRVNRRSIRPSYEGRKLRILPAFEYYDKKAREFATFLDVPLPIFPTYQDSPNSDLSHRIAVALDINRPLQKALLMLFNQVQTMFLASFACKSKQFLSEDLNCLIDAIVQDLKNLAMDVGNYWKDYLNYVKEMKKLYTRRNQEELTPKDHMDILVYRLGNMKNTNVQFGKMDEVNELNPNPPKIARTWKMRFDISEQLREILSSHAQERDEEEHCRIPRLATTIPDQIASLWGPAWECRINNCIYDLNNSFTRNELIPDCNDHSIVGPAPTLLVRYSDAQIEFMLATPLHGQDKKQSMMVSSPVRSEAVLLRGRNLVKDKSGCWTVQE